MDGVVEAEPPSRAGGPGPAEVDLERVGRLVVRGALVLVAVAAAVVALTAGSGERVDLTAPLAPIERAGMVALAQRVTVTVASRGCGPTVAGSGVVVADGRILTNRHVVAGAATVTVTDPSGLVVDVVPVVGASSGLDLAALGAASLSPGGRRVGPVPGPELAGADPVPGEPVVVAAAWGGGLRWMEARVQGVVDGAAYGSDGSVLLVDVPIVAGFSGGPVLDRNRRLVGVLRSVDLATALSVAIPASELSPWLRGAQRLQAESSCMND